MTSPEYLLAVIVLVLGLVYTWNRKKFTNLPPGPKPLPIIGNLHQTKGSLYETFIDLSKKYGDIFTIHLGSFRAVVLNNPKLIREAFAESAFSGRTLHLPFTKDRQKGGNWGVAGSEGQVWMEQRRFTLKTLRDFGFGKKSVESLVLDEVNDLIEGFKKSAGKPIQTQNRFNVAVLNALWQMTTGRRYSHDDAALQDIINVLSSAVQGSAIVNLAMFQPFLYYLVVLLPRKYLGKDFFAGRHRIMDLVRKEIKEHQETFQPDAIPRDFIDVYLAEMQKPGAGGQSFNGEDGIVNLLYTLLDLFVAGSETTSTTMTWLFLLMALNPDKQSKLHEEIDRVVGKSRLPSLNDKTSMPYTEASIMEVMRYSALVPTGVFHASVEDKTFQGYDIPKGTVIIPNLYWCMKDPSIWGDPENFRPERFLSPDGKSVVKHEALIPFSIGKRFCLGETLAKDELFLFTTALCQRFGITPDPNGEPLKVDFYKTGSLVPKPHNLVLIDRFEE